MTPDDAASPPPTAPAPAVNPTPSSGLPAGSPYAALAAAEAAARAPTAAAPAVNIPPPVGVPSGSPYAALASAEADDYKAAQTVIGQAQVQREQDAYDVAIRAQNAQRDAQQTTAQQPAATSGMTSGERLDDLKATAEDVGHRIYDVGRGAVAGVVNAVGELGSAAADLVTSNHLDSQALWQYQSEHATDPLIRAAAQHQLQMLLANKSKLPEEIREGAEALAPKTDTLGGHLAEGITQFMAAFVPVTEALKAAQLAKAGSFVLNTIGGGITQAAAFNPNDSRLSNLIQRYPALRNPITEYLASKPGDTEADGRLKNFLEGTVLNAAGEGVVEAFSSVLRGMRASSAIADTVKGIADAKPTEVPPSAPAETTSPAASPAVSPAGTAEVTSGETAGAPQATAAAAPELKPYIPPALKDVTGVQPRVAEPAGAAGAPTFDPEAFAKVLVQVPADKADAIRQAIVDGKYNAVPAMLDDTHRTIPWDSLSDGANLKGLFNAVEDNIGGLIKDAHGVAPVPAATIQQLARDIGGNVQAVTRLYGDSTASGGLAARITAGYNIMTASARRLKELAEDAHALNPETQTGQQAILAFQKQLELHAAIVGQVRRSSSEIARALYAHRALKASSDVALTNLSELMGTTMGPGAIKTFLKNVKDADDIAAVTKATDQVRGKGLMGVIKEIANNGMLSGLPTQIANITGNASNAIVKVVERYLAGAIGQVRGVFMPNADVATLRAAVAHTVGAVAGIRDSFPLMVRALAHEQSVSAMGRPLVRAIHMEPEGLRGIQLTTAQLINRVGQAIRYPGRLMGAIDNLNMGVGYQADLNARVYLQSAKEADAQALTGNARDAFLDKRMAELRADPPPEVRERAWDEGLYQSFQEKAKTRFGELISKGLNSHPLVKLIFAPFVHRPLNMLRQSLMDYTPAGLLSRTMRAKLAAGNADTDVAIARMLLGTGAVMTSYEMAANGYTTGARLGSRNTESLDNIPTYSAKVGDRWWRFDRLDPLGTWLAIGADLHEQIAHHYDPSNPQSTADLATLARAAVQITGQVALDKSFMQSVDTFLQAIGQKNPNAADVAFQKFVASNAGKFVPFSGALRGIAHSTDTTERATGGDGWMSIWDTIKGSLPNLSESLPPRRDILGRPVLYPAGADTWWNPFGGAKEADDNMDRELAKLAVNVSTPKRQLDGIVLDPESYDELITRSTQARIFPGGTNLEGYLRELTGSEMWHQFDSTDDHGVTAHTKLVQQAIDAAYQYGRMDYAQAHPNFQQAQAQRALQEAQHYMVQ